MYTKAEYATVHFVHIRTISRQENCYAAVGSNELALEGTSPAAISVVHVVGMYMCIQWWWLINQALGTAVLPGKVLPGKVGNL